MNKYWKRMSQWIFESWPINARQLSVLRIFYASWSLYILGIPKYTQSIAYFPDGGFNPVPGFGRLFSEMPPIWFFQLGEWLTWLGFTCLLVGFFTRFWSVLLPFIVLFCKSLVFASGKVDSSMLPIIIPLVFAGSDWGVFYAWKPTRFRGLHNQWPITYMSLMLGFGFFTAGIIKLLGGWLNPAHSMVYSYFLKNFYIYGREGILSNVFLQLNWLPFWELQDWMTLFLEIGFLIAIFWPVVYRLFTVLGMVFHVGVLLILRISFLEFVVIYALFWGSLIPD